MQKCEDLGKSYNKPALISLLEFDLLIKFPSLPRLGGYGIVSNQGSSDDRFDLLPWSTDSVWLQTNTQAIARVSRDMAYRYFHGPLYKGPGQKKHCVSWSLHVFTNNAASVIFVTRESLSYYRVDISW